ncbi:MAG: hypothetical protein ACREDD_09335 [Methylocella sp.]
MWTTDRDSIFTKLYMAVSKKATPKPKGIIEYVKASSLGISKTLHGWTSTRKRKWLKKLKTVSAELMASALSGERGKSGKLLSGFLSALGTPPPSCPRRLLPPIPGFAIGHSPDH